MHGSFVNGNAHENSDIDVSIVVKELEPLADYVEYFKKRNKLIKSLQEISHKIWFGLKDNFIVENEKCKSELLWEEK